MTMRQAFLAENDVELVMEDGDLQDIADGESARGVRDSNPHLSFQTKWHYNHHRHAHNAALNQEEKTYGSV